MSERIFHASNQPAVANKEQGSQPVLTRGRLANLLEDMQIRAFKHRDKRLSLPYLENLSKPTAKPLIDRLNRLCNRDDRRLLRRFNAISRYFSAVVDDESLPVIVRQLIGQLEVPFWRLGLVNETDVARLPDSAWQFLILLQQQASQWQPSEGRLEADAFLVCLTQVVHELLEVERLEQVDFTERQEKLSATLPVDSMGGLGSDAFIQQLMDDKSLAIRQSLEQRLAARLLSMQLPEPLQSLIAQCFSAWLLLTADREGVDSSRFRADAKRLDQFLLSLRHPGKDCSRSEFLAQIADTLPRLRQVLQLTPLDRSTIQALLDAAEAFHKSLMVKIPADEVIRLDDISAMLPAMPNPAEVDAIAPEPEAPRLVLRAGLCFDWLLKGKKQRCQLAAYIRHQDRYIITRMSGSKLGEVDTKELHQLIEKGEMVLLESNNRFERALELVIDGIRQR